LLTARGSKLTALQLQLPPQLTAFGYQHLSIFNYQSSRSEKNAMELNLTTPALLFPAITLLMLAYTNRFLGLANRVRSLHDKYLKDGAGQTILEQIRNIRARLHMIRYMQFMGALSFFLCVICMFCIFQGFTAAAHVVFGGSLAALLISLAILMWEIQISTKAVELELSDMEELSKDSSLLDYIRTRFDKGADNG
jgi:hypothetical protein